MNKSMNNIEKRNYLSVFSNEVLNVKRMKFDSIINESDSYAISNANSDEAMLTLLHLVKKYDIKNITGLINGNARLLNSANCKTEDVVENFIIFLIFL